MGAATAGAGDYNIVRRNTVYGTRSLNNDGSGIAADIYADNNEIYDNAVYSNDGPGITLFADSGNRIIGNTSSGNCLDLGGGLVTRGEIRVSGIATQPENDFQIKNNAVYATQASTSAIYVNAYAYDRNPDITGNLWSALAADWYFWNNAAGSDLSVWNDLLGVGQDSFIDLSR